MRQKVIFSSSEYPSKNFANRFKRWRRNSGHPLKRLAYDLGVSVTTISEWENGNRFPTGLHLDAISSHTSIPLCAFFRPSHVNCPHFPDTEKAQESNENIG